MFSGCLNIYGRLRGSPKQLKTFGVGPITGELRPLPHT